MEQKKIDRINELARKAKTEGLSEEELKERDELRKEYIASWRQGLENELNNTYIIDKNGKKTKLTKKNK